MKKILYIIFPFVLLVSLFPCYQSAHGARISGDDKSDSNYDNPQQPPAMKTSPKANQTKAEMITVPEDGRTQIPSPTIPESPGLPTPPPPMSTPAVNQAPSKSVKATTSVQGPSENSFPQVQAPATGVTAAGQTLHYPELAAPPSPIPVGKSTLTTTQGGAIKEGSHSGSAITGSDVGKRIDVAHTTLTQIEPEGKQTEEIATANKGPSNGSQYITIDFDGVDIQVFIKFIGELTGKNFVIDERVKGKVTVMSPRKISIDEAYKVFHSVLDVYGFAAVPSGNIIKIIPVQQAKEKNVLTLLKDEALAPEDKVVTQIITLNYANVDEIKRVLDPLVPKNSVVLSYSPTGMLIITDILSNIQRIQEIVKALDVKGMTEQVLKVYRLQNATAEDLAKILTALPKEGKDGIKSKSPLISKEVQVVSDKATNSLLITADKNDYAILEDVIKQLDVPRPMVFIEALIMEVNVNKDFKIGVEWRGLVDTGKMGDYKTATFFGSGGAGENGNYNILPLYDSDKKTFTYPGGFSMGILGSGIKIGGVVLPNIAAVLQAYQTDSDVSILSTPQVLTVNNEEAEIHVGKNVPYVTRQEQNTTGVDYSSYEYKDVGVNLRVTPNINENGYVRLKIDQEVTKVITAESKAGLPTTLKRSAKTMVVIKNGETVVIGGLVGDATEKSTYKVPILGSIPVLGWLFKTMSNDREKTNLYIFLTPHIVRNQEEVKVLSNEKRQEMGVVEEGVIKLNEIKKN